MNRRARLALTIVLLSSSAQGQRHGRPDAVQNYLNRHRAPNPILSVRLEDTKKWVYVHRSEISNLKVSIISVRDKTGATHVYAGILLRDLLPNEKGLEHLAVFKPSHWRWTDRYVLSSDERAVNEDTLIAYSKDGVGLPSSYSLVIPMKNVEPIVVNEIASVKIGLSKH